MSNIGISEVLAQELEKQVKQLERRKFNLDSEIANLEDQIKRRIREVDEIINKKLQNFETMCLTKESELSRKVINLDNREKDIKLREGELISISQEFKNLEIMRQSYQKELSDLNKFKIEVYRTKESLIAILNNLQ